MGSVQQPTRTREDHAEPPGDRSCKETEELVHPQIESVDKLFGKFSRLTESDLTQRKRGTGMGLFVAKHIIEAHGGRISARSKQGEWAEFTFTLPTCKKAAE